MLAKRLLDEVAELLIHSDAFMAGHRDDPSFAKLNQICDRCGHVRLFEVIDSLSFLPRWVNSNGCGHHCTDTDTANIVIVQVTVWQLIDSVNKGLEDANFPDSMHTATS